jgi:hypothetical protein
MIAMATKYPTGDPMTLGNMRVLGVQRLSPTASTHHGDMKG